MADRPTPESPEPAPLTLRTLGGTGLYSAGGSELLLGPGKPLALLVYLALTPGRRTSRAFLTELLWADLDPDRARPALRQALFQLRRVLGEDVLAGSEELSLARPVAADRDRFLDAVERGEPEAALEIYGGAFLPAFGVPGGAAFEHWADLERDRLRAVFLRTGEILVRRHLNQSRFREAQRLARRVRDEVPDEEAAWRLVLETVIAGRDFVSAAVEADALEHRAAADGLRLEASTRLAVARARQVTPAPSDPRDGGTLIADLTGREREFSAITAAWDSASAGRARHLHLTAPAGLGKTRLLRDAAARLLAAGAPVVQIRGAPGERDIPFAFAGDLVGAIAELPGATGIAPATASALIALNPSLSSRFRGAADAAVGEEALRRRIHAVSDLVHAVAAEQPFVVVIDDMHWVDPPSYRVLEGLFGRLEGAPVLCLTAARPERLPAADSISTLPLAPLTTAQIGSLVLALGTLPDGASWTNDFAAGVHRATRGSPLLILETLRLALDRGVLALTAGEWHCLDQAQLDALLRAGAALRQRVGALPEEHGWVLAVLATAGTPLVPDSLAAAMQRTPADLSVTLTALERQGLVARSEGEWTVAHDEIAAAARDALDPRRRREAHRLLGVFLAGGAREAAHHLFRGIRHLVAADQDPLVRRHFRRFARVARAAGDRRSFTELAAECLGEDGESPRAKALAASLPRRWRMGLWSPARQRTAAAAVLVIAGGAGAALRTGDARDATVQRLVYVDSLPSASVVRVRAGDWNGRAAPVVPARARTAMAQAALAFRELPPAISPDGRSVAWNQDSGDSTTLDIWLRTPAGVRRLTRQFRDDLVSSWLPDGSGLVGLTNRWSSPGNGDYDVAIFDTATGVARQVTGGPDHDQPPYASPDGTRIAFVRQSDDHAPRLCIAAFDGRGAPECRFVGGHPPANLLGWSGLAELVVTLDSAAARVLVRYDWQRNEHATLLGPHVYRGAMSPDRRWVVGAVRLEGLRGFRDWVIPVDRPAHARRVELAGDGALARWWEGTPDRSELIDRIELTDTTGTILPGIGTRFAVRALTAGGTEIPLHAPVRWTSSDTLVATVDSTGDVHPRSTGAVTITASLGGWRTTSRRVTVGGEPPVTEVDERWNDDWTARWITFGDPHPQVTTGPGMIRALWNRGDGTYPSLAMLRRSFSARNGLGVELHLSTPVTRADWQRARTYLVAGVDTVALQGSDQRKAPAGAGAIERTCGAGYPGAPGAFGERRLAGSGGISQLIDLGPAATGLRSGAWWTLRLQILPDGRCGIAVNGRVLWLSPESIPLEGEFRLRLGDESAGTRMLHGPLTIWTGVRTDLDWSRPPR